MNLSVRRQKMRPVQTMSPALHVRYLAARFFNQQFTSCHVPGAQAEFPKSVQPAASHVRQINGRRAAPPDAMRHDRQLIKEVNIDVQVPAAAGESRGEQRHSDARCCRNLNAPVVQVSATAALRRKHLVPRRVIHHAGDQLTLMLQRQRHVVYRIAVCEIRRPVHRIHIPAVFAALVVQPALFGHNRVRRKVRTQSLQNQCLARPVGFGHQILLALALKPHAAIEILGRQRARFASDFRCNLKIRSHGCFAAGSSNRYLISCL